MHAAQQLLNAQYCKTIFIIIALPRITSLGMAPKAHTHIGTRGIAEVRLAAAKDYTKSLCVIIRIFVPNSSKSAVVCVPDKTLTVCYNWSLTKQLSSRMSQ